MTSVSVRRLISLIGAFVALMTAVAVPLGYGIVAYWKEAEILSFRAELSAARASSHFKAHGGIWTVPSVDLIDSLAVGSSHSSPIVQKIFDADNRVVAIAGSIISGPVLSRSAQIQGGGPHYAWVEAQVSLKPLIANVLAVALVTGLAGLGIYWAFLAIPLRALDRMVGKLEQARAEIVQQNIRLDLAVSNMVQGLCMFDRHQRVVVANKRYAEIYGLSTDEVRPGTHVRQILEARLAKGIYGEVDAEAFVRDGLARFGQRVTIVHHLADGRVVNSVREPLPDGGLITTHEDITEQAKLSELLEEQNERLKEQEQKLQSQNIQLDAALNNMAHGLCMFDGQQRVLLANARYAEMYGLTAEQVKPGTSLRQIVEARISLGVFAGPTPDDYIQERLATFHGPQTNLHRLSDGRIISICRTPMAGGGWVTTHEDVTERHKLHDELERQHRLVKEQQDKLQLQNVQLEATLNNMSQGVCLFDKHRRVVICNDLYLSMYGLSREQVRPGTHVRKIIEHRIANGLYAGKNPQEYMRERMSPETQSGNAIHKLNDGRYIAYAIRIMPDGGGVATHEDITERQMLSERIERQYTLLTEQEGKLSAQNEQLDAALNNMAQGLCMFDAEERIIISNNRFAEMYGFDAEQVKPGTKLSDILQARIDSGLLEGRSVHQILDRLRERSAERQAFHMDSQLADGRSISIFIQPRQEGGWVTTHQDITERRRSEAKIVHMAYHDSLTDLPNRVLFSERLAQGLARVERGEFLAVHLIDLDQFKHVNDTLGHPIGDRLLKAVAERLSTSERTTDTIARMGGDEFAIVQVGLRDEGDATALAQRVMDLVSEPYDIDGHHIVIGASIGIALAPTDGLDPDQLMRNADLALYRAKDEGRNTYRFFEREMDARMQARISLEQDMRKALTNNEFELHYQPIVNIESGDITCFEALIRWNHPQRGMISPGEFIPLAEESGFIVALGEWALRSACATAATWPGSQRVAVNLSALQFQKPGLIQIVVGALAASGLPARRLELEITESVLMEDSEATIATLHQFRELGLRISMDDFGTGYSSLRYLQSFPFDKIKIDRAFIQDVTENHGTLSIVRAVTTLARSLGMATTAEGIETQEQLDLIRAEGCTEMQGYFFSAPQKAGDVQRLFFAKDGLRIYMPDPSAKSVSSAA